MTATTTLPAHAAAIAAQLAEATNAIRQWQEIANSAKQALLQLHEAGEVPTSFKEAGCSFRLQQGRRTVVLDDDIKQLMKELEADALASGKGTVKVGQPFWTVK